MNLEFETIFRETIDMGIIQEIKRAQVFGGWLVSEIIEIELENTNKISSNMTFLSDPNHEWSLND